MLSLFKGIATKIGLNASIKNGAGIVGAQLHTSTMLNAIDDLPKKFLFHNTKIYPPQIEGEEPRQAVCFDHFVYKPFINYK